MNGKTLKTALPSAHDNHSLFLLYESSASDSKKEWRRIDLHMVAPIEIIEDPEMFARYVLVDGTIAWPTGYRIKPEILYTRSIPVAKPRVRFRFEMRPSVAIEITGQTKEYVWIRTEVWKSHEALRNQESWSLYVPERDKTLLGSTVDDVLLVSAVLDGPWWQEAAEDDPKKGSDTFRG
ncbi:MAG: hypothetical protein K6T83_07990 [Alicyclobacillus sp.]|nr:hypothetical protein [Alicyclobacillus sp.]